MEFTNGKIGRSFFWKLMDGIGSYSVSLICSIVVARKLMPWQYGDIAIALIFIGVANVIVQNGFGMALIQKREVDETDFSSVLIINLIAASILYIIIFFSSNIISEIFNSQALVPVLRMLGIILFFGAGICVYNGYVARKLEFRLMCIATLIASTVSGVLSIILANRNYGIYALVYQQISYNLVLLAVLIFTVDLKYNFKFEIERLRALFMFGYKILIASLIDNIFNALTPLFMGKIYSTKALGNYNRGEQFPKLIAGILSTVIASVVFPILSCVQDEKGELKRIMKNGMMLSSFFIFPLIFGMLAISDRIILILLGEHWRGAIIFMKVMCIGFALWHIHVINIHNINAMGRSDIYLKLEIIKKIINTIALVIGIYFGAVYMAVLKSVADIISFFINSYPNKKLINYGTFEQLKSFSKPLISSLLMCFVVYISGKYFPVDILSTILLIILGMIVYFVFSIIIRDEACLMCINYIKGKFYEKNICN